MISDLLDRIARLEHRLANLNPVGPVAERDHEKGIRLNLGTDDAPFLTPWFQPGDRTGASRYVPQKNEQVMLVSIAGDWQQAIGIPLTHSDEKKNPAKNIDETVHHARDGQRHTVEKGHVKDQADKRFSRAAGDGGTEAEGAGMSGANLSHELNRQLQGIRATLTQHDNHFAGLHQATSQFRDIVQKVIPQVAAVQPLLNGDAASFGKASQQALGSLESYVAKTFEQLVGKLTNGFMSNVMALVQGAMQGQITALLGQVGSLAQSSGVAQAVASPLAAAQALAAQAAGGTGHGAFNGHLDAIGTAFGGGSGGNAFGDLRSQITGLLGGASSIGANLGGALDAQQNLVKGMTHSYRLGGYEGGEA